MGGQSGGMYVYKNLADVGFEELTAVWNLAFSDNIVDMEMTAERLEAYFKISGVVYSLSFGAFYNEKLVGMLMNSVDIYKGKIVAYDAMTGVVPEHRGKGLFSELFEYTRSALKDSGVTFYYLEVIQTNEKAYNIYSGKGGKIEREYSFLKGRTDGVFSGSGNVKALPLSEFPDEEICLYEPSFSNRVTAMRRNEDDYKVALLDKTSVVFNTQGRITQILYRGAEDKEALGSILSYLSQKFKGLEISNIPSTETDLIKELLGLGFNTIVEQYEMSFEL